MDGVQFVVFCMLFVIFHLHRDISSNRLSMFNGSAILPDVVRLEELYVMLSITPRMRILELFKAELIHHGLTLNPVIVE